MELQYLFKETRVKTFVDVNNDPWFVAKEIAAILGYKDKDQAIRKHVDDEDKLTCNELLNSMKGRPVEITGLTFNEKNSVYINESGLYSLILKSKMKEAKMFKRWVTKEVLPSIRKNGEFRIKEELSAEFEQKLAIMDSQVAEIKQKVMEKEQESEHAKQVAERELQLRLQVQLEAANAIQSAERELKLRLEKEKQLEKEIEQKHLLEKHLSRYQKIEKDDIIYVLTNENDLKNNVFKVGKTTKKNYKNRLSQYNTGSSVENYYVFMSECFDAKLVEKTFSFYLDKYKLKVAYDEKEKTNDEMYKMNIEDLLSLLKMIVENHGEVGDYVNENHETIFRKSVSVESKVSKVIEWKNALAPGGARRAMLSKVKRSNLSDVSEEKMQVPERLNTNRDWLFKVIEISGCKADQVRSCAEDYVSLSRLRELYKMSFPLEKKLKNKEIERMIIILLQEKGLFIRDRYRPTVKGKQTDRRNVFVGCKLKVGDARS